MSRLSRTILYGTILSIFVPAMSGASRHRSRARHLVEMSPTANRALQAKLAGAKTTAHPQPLSVNVGGREQVVCGPDGDARSAKVKKLDENKNRTDTPPASGYIEIGWNDLKTLPGSRANDFQGAPVAVEGYLSHHIKVETAPPGESTNCHLHQKNEVDWHMYLTDEPRQGLADAIIVETTPRTRPAHSWTTAKLEKYLNSGTKVRISGWLLYDWEHLDAIGRQRTSVWEVHPITRIEVKNSRGEWVDIEKR